MTDPVRLEKAILKILSSARSDDWVSFTMGDMLSRLAQPDILLTGVSPSEIMECIASLESRQLLIARKYRGSQYESFPRSARGNDFYMNQFFGIGSFELKLTHEGRKAIANNASVLGDTADRAGSEGTPVRGMTTSAAGTTAEWEKVGPEPLGAGGQSTVYLVRRPERKAARERDLKVLRSLSGQGLDNQTSVEFAKAAFDLARDENPTEIAALKQFDPRAAGPEAEQQALERMRNEIAVLKQGRRGLVKLLDYNESQNWIVTEYCSKGTLEQHLLRYKGNVQLALSAFLPLVEAVKALHGDSIVHRDIKPQNIFVGSNDELLLGDFGLVFLPNRPERLTVTGESVGPRDFMPPWVLIDDRPTIRPSFDVYMLGKVLWCMVTGRLKLHREDFRDPRLDVTKLFPHDPSMHIVNEILSASVVTREEDCLLSAHDLLPRVVAYVEMLRQRGQLLHSGIPRPCHVCGAGLYEASREGSLSIWVSNNNTTNLPIKAMRCDTCGHVELFTPTTR